ncbi:DNA alkylation repair protein [Methanobacterium aggregans]|uniref:DNA alkylation repair protein n=1 Tax=Methanobacterium aggregans TaxID=1615586 RepID=UPI001AE42E41|nr:DNA alkylation repair protein [Methanobacterium aggregans]MBP2046227.1 3-methyladenine DNA glycosylase AlkD [Methanobacterium aggregans]
MNYEEVLERFVVLSQKVPTKSAEHMSRVGITPKKTYGIRIPHLRELAREIGKDHELALRLWESNTRETRILACMIEDKDLVTEEQMEKWVTDFNYWEICDQCCMNLFEKMPIAYEKAVEWSFRDEEFVKRAGFALMARLAVSDKKTPDDEFEKFFPHIMRGSLDDRNYVKKAVNWALCQVGKRNRSLNKKAIENALEIKKIPEGSAKWIASDALRELRDEKVQKRFKK